MGDGSPDLSMEKVWQVAETVGVLGVIGTGQVYGYHEEARKGPEQTRNVPWNQ
jgi:hypothetical protein